MKTTLRYGTFPLFFVGFNGLGLWLIASGASAIVPYVLLALAVAAMFGIEQVIPWQPDWNRDPGDAGADIAHAIVNTALTYTGVVLLPQFTALLSWPGVWPAHWPFLAQVVVAVVILDLGIAAVHHASHRHRLLWRFHAIHHATGRLYGFNGWMKHPLHQLLETAGGIAPLLLLGVSQSVVKAVGFCVAVQLLLQHANVDYRIGVLKHVFATAERHRFHHRKGVAGNVNFGLFTLLWDRLMGTAHYAAADAPRSSEAVGLDPPQLPRGYWAQLAAPFQRQPS